jgi:hypothetical protein
MMNTPAQGSRVALPTTFHWKGPIQPVKNFLYRIHSQPYTSFQLVYQSAKLPPTADTYVWGGTGLLVGTRLDPAHRYFWGVKWDWDQLGEGGNLYQPIYMTGP